jgi:hypothetical protein
MGMSLAIHFSIVEAHDGWLRATKIEIGRATFLFILSTYSDMSQ